MTSKKSKIQSNKSDTSKQKNQKLSLLIVVAFVLAIAIAASLFFLNKENPVTENSTADLVEKSLKLPEAIPIETKNFQKLIGRWLRPDGRYVIEISEIDANGKLNAAYFNPRSINVSEAQANLQDEEIEIFIELTDVGYPGATYDLVYDSQLDVLVGVYYQPTVGQRFDVEFVRIE